MDYAKLAYLKADDLSKRIANIEQSKKSQFSSTSVIKNINKQFERSFETGVVRIFNEIGSCLTLIVRIRLTLEISSQATLKICINDIPCYSSTVWFASGQQDFFALVTITASDQTSAISAIVEGDNLVGVFDSIEVAAWGESVSKTPGEANVCVIESTQELEGIVAAILEDKLVFYRLPPNEPLPDFTVEPEVFCSSISFGICRKQDSFYIAYVDLEGNLYLVNMATPEDRILIESGVESTAISFNQDTDELVIAYIKGEEGYYRLVSAEGCISQSIKVQLPSAPFAGVSMINSSTKPVFVFRTASDKLYLKFGLDCIGRTEENVRKIRCGKEFL